MAEHATLWRPRGAWDLYAHAGRHGRSEGPAGVTATPREGLALMSVTAVDGAEERLAAALRDRFGLSLPEPGGALFSGETGLIWSGPGQWLALAPTRGDLDGFGETLKGLAAVADQSDGRAVLRLSGPDARRVLEKGVSVDLHPRAFGPGHTAVTAVAHIGVQLWQRDDAPTYEIAVARSFAGSLWSWLEEAAAEFGCEVRVA
ncbi:sarcosine oxidase subunit gamma [Methylorubrum salsuginis]|uniref:N-methylglutamate dehydrogenase subunit D n=1 Tax=Methylorubrum salsuginis TaxID=414703 RepID=A0A1I4K9Q8_9HYPH|nr:sarcosine oxidase subunit gamma family protein [Methylorubrum salsuginis]SFL75494.1 N-methylglutamate dehydrogenase subunit D [Methylorubrum salsuginis]